MQGQALPSVKSHYLNVWLLINVSVFPGAEAGCRGGLEALALPTVSLHRGADRGAALVGNTQTQSLSGDITSGAMGKEKWPKSGIFSTLCGMRWLRIFHI